MEFGTREGYHLKRKVNLCIGTHFYLRTHKIIPPLNELLKESYFPYTTLTNAQREEKIDLKDKFFLEWGKLLSESTQGSQYFDSWKPTNLNNSLLEIQPNQTELSYLNTPIVPTYLKESKGQIMDGQLSEVFFDAFKNFALAYWRRDQFEMNIENMKANVWIFDWNSGGVDLDITINLQQSDDLKKLKKFASAILEAFFKFLDHFKLPFPSEQMREEGNLINYIGKRIVTSRNQLLGKNEEYSPSFKFAKRYFDVSKILFFELTKRTDAKDNLIEINENEFLQELERFTSARIASEDQLKSIKSEVQIFASGFMGTVSVLDSGHINYPKTKVRIAWLWRLSAFYIAGLSKLNHRLSTYSCKLVGIQDRHTFVSDPIVKSFPAFRLRKVAYLQEMELSYKADKALDVKSFSVIWKAMRGDFFQRSVLHQLEELSGYIKNTQQQYQFEQLADEQQRKEAEKEYRLKKEEADQKKKDKQNWIISLFGVLLAGIGLFNTITGLFYDKKLLYFVKCNYKTELIISACLLLVFLFSLNFTSIKRIWNRRGKNLQFTEKIEDEGLANSLKRPGKLGENLD